MEVIDVAGDNSDTVQKLRAELNSWIATQLAGGRKDPAIYDDLDFMQKEVKIYRDKISRLLDSFKTGK